jgi:hypothetical protein
MSGTKTTRAKSLPKARQLKVVFDTSAIFTGSASDLLRREVVKVVEANRKHDDLEIQWCLPEVVKYERRYQMFGAACQLLPPVAKLERILGHNLNITEQIVSTRIDETIDRQIEVLGLNILPLDYSDVDLKQMMVDSANRQPPFSPNESEKGFRDALIVETFVQLVGASPVSPGTCLVTLVASDDLLSNAARARTADSRNVRVLSSTDELRDLINVLVAQIGEDFATVLREKVKGYFFSKDDDDCLFQRERIHEKIWQRFADELQIVPEGADDRDNERWLISSPSFSKKVGQRVHWTSRIEVEAKAFKSPTSVFETPGTVYPGTLGAGIRPQSSAVLELSGRGDFPLVGSTQELSHPTTYDTSTGLTFNFPSERKLVSAGMSIFEVSWSVSVTTAGNITRPKVESLDYVETTWD